MPHGRFLVRSLFSLISTGTEMMKVSEASMSMVGMARTRPDQVRKVLDAVQQQGLVTTYKKVMNRLDSYTPLGYSLCRVVTEVGRGAEEFKVGQLVAAAGNEHALHAEHNWVPVNLCAAVPPGVLPEHAAFSTVASIAMHGVRRAEVQLGETAAVIGLGLVGQLVVRLLVAAGVQVVGLDPVAARCQLAEQAGADAVRLARRRRHGGRAWGAGRHHQGTRRRSRVPGGGRLDQRAGRGGGEAGQGPRQDRRHRQDETGPALDRVLRQGAGRPVLPVLRPGRYDDRYELDGIDYPVGYVRWTEKRNLESFLDLVARHEIEVSTLISGVFPFADAAEVYADLKSGELKAVGVLLEYPVPAEDAPAPRDEPLLPGAKAPARPASARKQHVAVGFIGAGNYASSMLLPQPGQLGSARLAHVATTVAFRGQRPAEFGFTTASTDADAVLEDASLDAIFIVTRHQTHADFVCRALETGKAVFVEKPLALTVDEIDRIIKTIEKTGNDRLMVGFNRRFAPLLVQLKEELRPDQRRHGGAVPRQRRPAGPG